MSRGGRRRFDQDGLAGAQPRTQRQRADAPEGHGVHGAARLLAQPPAARGLASKRRHHALVYDNPSDNYIVNLQRGALEARGVYDYSLLSASATTTRPTSPRSSCRACASTPRPG